MTILCRLLGHKWRVRNWGIKPDRPGGTVIQGDAAYCARCGFDTVLSPMLDALPEPPAPDGLTAIDRLALHVENDLSAPDLADLHAEVEAMRQRAEAAEARADELESALVSVTGLLGVAKAGQVAAWEAGRDAAKQAAQPWDKDTEEGRAARVAAVRNIEALTPPSELSAALNARMGAEWNAAIEAAAKALEFAAANWDCGHNESRLCDCARDAEQWGFAADEVRALRRDAPKGDGA
jgi:hypothetical protein